MTDGQTTIQTRHSLVKLLNPSAIAVIGASEAQGTVGHAILVNLERAGFRGKIFLVNPKYAGKETTVCTGSPCPTYVASTSELPQGEIDLALIMTPRQTVVSILETLADKGISAVVVITAGFQEIGEAGVQLSEELKRTADSLNITIVGPNCLGIANTSPSVRMFATFALEAPPYGHGAVLSQSGAVGIDIIDRARRSGLGLAQFVSMGNELQIGPRELIEHWHKDSEVNYILGYMEAGRSLGRIREIAGQVTPDKPILMIKSAKSVAGARAAKSHTGALAGSDEAVNALMIQTGIHRCESVAQLFSAAQAFEYTRPAIGNRVAIFSNAGGYAVMATDLLDPRFGKNKGLVLATFSPHTLETLNQLLPLTASKQNPVDTTATAPIDNLHNYREALKAIMSDPNVDACIVSIVPLMDMRLEEIAMVASGIQQTVGKPIVSVLSTSEEALGDIQRAVMQAGLPPVALYTNIEDAITGLGALEKQRLWRQRPRETPIRFDDVDQEQVASLLRRANRERRTLLTTMESLEVLAAYGIRIPRQELVTTLDEALACINRIGYPVAIKLNSKTVSHKTEVGGVRVDIRNEGELIGNFQAMMEDLRRFGIQSFQKGEGIIVQAFLSRGREVILGASEDPDFGKLLVIGRGGIYARIDQDVQFRLAPLTRLDTQEMISGIRAYKILRGYRGKPGVDLATLEDALIRLSQLVEDFSVIAELDINPFMALPATTSGQKAGVAVDSRIILK